MPKPASRRHPKKILKIRRKSADNWRGKDDPLPAEGKRRRMSKGAGHTSIITPSLTLRGLRIKSSGRLAQR
jgi:hypothetical protein